MELLYLQKVNESYLSFCIWIQCREMKTNVVGRKIYWKKFPWKPAGKMPFNFVRNFLTSLLDWYGIQRNAQFIMTCSTRGCGCRFLCLIYLQSYPKVMMKTSDRFLSFLLIVTWSYHPIFMKVCNNIRSYIFK